MIPSVLQKLRVRVQTVAITYIEFRHTLQRAKSHVEQSSESEKAPTIDYRQTWTVAGKRLLCVSLLKCGEVYGSTQA